MTGHDERSAAIASGTVEGLLAFCDYLIDKGYASSAAVNPWKSAVRQVFQTLEGEMFGSTDIRGLDVDEAIDRFATRRRGDLKAESVDAYRARLRRALDAYLGYLAHGRPPQLRHGASRRPKAGTKETTLPRVRSEGQAAAHAEPITAPAQILVDYPFPLQSGQMAELRLPRKLEKLDAERIAAFVRTLVFEPVGELPSGRSEDQH